MFEASGGVGGWMGAESRAMGARVGWLGNPTGGETLSARRRARARERETDDVSRVLSTCSRGRDDGEDDREGIEAPTASPQD